MTKKTRTGKCLRCGKCCKFKNLYESLSEEGLKLLKRFHSHGKINKMLKEDFVCPYLVKGKDGKYSCGQYFTRPSWCREFPTTEADICHKDCGFKFIDKQGGSSPPTNTPKS